MWPFTQRRYNSFDEKLLDALKSDQRKLSDLEVRLTELESKHMALRGRVYGVELHKRPLKDSEEDRAATIPMTKDELRKKAGLHAGKPYPHSEEKPG